MSAAVDGPVETVETVVCPAHDCITVDGRCQRCLEEAAQGVYLITDYPEIVHGRGLA